MFSYQEDAKNGSSRPPGVLKILYLGSLAALLVLMWTRGPLIERFLRAHTTVGLLLCWALGMLSYHQDARYRIWGWAIFVSQTFSVACLINLVVFGFTRRSWPNFLIVGPLAWLHVELTRRWWAKPGKWW